MAVHLSEGAVGRLCRGEAVETVVKPILQVMDLKLVCTKQQQQQPNERFRMMLSDGVMMQQGMLGTQMNHLIKDGKLQVGSIVVLNQYVLNVIQQRIIIIVIELDVLVEKCDPIGQPAMVPRPGSTQTTPVQPALVSGNPQYLGGSSTTNSAVSGDGVSMQHPRPNQPIGSGYSGNVDSGRFGANNASPLPQKAEPNSSYSGSAPHNSSFPGSAPPNNSFTGSAPPNNYFTGSSPLTGSYGNQNRSFNNAREVSRAPSSGYIPPPQQRGYQQQPPPMYGNRGAVARNEAPPRLIPIAALNPYQGRWTIKARVTAKSELRHYNNPRGEGKLFSFDLLDADGGEIRVTCFNAVVDQFYNIIEVGKVYTISKGNIKPAQKAYNHLANDYEIHLETTSVIQPCLEEDNAIPQQQFHFRPISDVEGLENNSVLDLIGIVSSIGPVTSIMRKNGTETQKRSLQLKDMSGRSVELTLWGNFANTEGHRLQSICDSGVFPVLAVKAGRVNEFNGKAIGSISSTQLLIDPDFQEARQLREWFDNEGKNMVLVSISRDSSGVGRTDIRKVISQIKDEKLGTTEKVDWITVSGTIIYIKSDNFCYTACPLMNGERTCSKKVTNHRDGAWRCDRCDKSVDECDYRYILQLQIQDHTAMTYATSFQECGEEIMGISAKDLYFLKFEHHDDEKVAEIFRNALFKKCQFKLKVKEEIVNDEPRAKSTVVKVEKMNWTSEGKFLFDMVDKIRAGDDLGSTVVKAESSIHNPGVSDFESRQPANSYMNSNNSDREIGLPVNQVGQLGNQHNSPPPVPCTSCGLTGHSHMQCPTLLSGPGIGAGYGGSGASGMGVNTSSTCYKCHKTGHWARDCPGSASAYNRSSISQGGYGRV